MGEGDRKSRSRGAYIFSDGSLIENRNVEGGAYLVGSGGAEVVVECEVGNVAAVWDGEVAGMAGGLTRARQNVNNASESSDKD